MTRELKVIYHRSDEIDHKTYRKKIVMVVAFFKKYKITAAAILLTAVGLLLRTHSLSTYSLWYDEAGQLYMAQEFWYFYTHHALGTDLPLALFLLRLWSAIVPWTPGWLRLFSVMCSTAIIPVTFLIVQRVLNNKAAMIATLFATINPFSIFYAQEIKSYALYSLISAVNLFFFLHLLKPKRAYEAGFVLSTILNLGIHFFAYLTIVTQVLFIFLHWRSYRQISKRLFIYSILICLGCIPYVQNLFASLFKVGFEADWWIPKPQYTDILYTFKALLVGYNAPATLVWVYCVAFGIPMIVGSVRLFRQSRECQFIVIGILLPCVIAYAGSIFNKNSAFLTRNFIGYLAHLLIIISAGVIIPRKYYTVIAVTLLCLITIPGITKFYNNEMDDLSMNPGVRPKNDYQNAAVYIEKRFQEGDVICHTCNSSLMPFLVFYLPNHPNFYVVESEQQLQRIQQLFAFEDLSSVKNNAYGVYLESLLPKYKRVWLVCSVWDLGAENHYSQATAAILKRMMNEYQIQEKTEFYGLPIYLFDLSERRVAPD